MQREIRKLAQEELPKLQTFLEGFDLHLDQVDTSIVMEENGKIIATCSKYANIFKCFAILPEYQGEGIAATLLTELTYLAFEEGYHHTFLYTKPAQASIFIALGYEEIIRISEVVMLEKGLQSIRKTIAAMKQQLSHVKECAAIVMNGNPFTLGHQYLIETAAAMCGHLAVFVVEEDASSVLFADRYAMIQAGTAHLSNVSVLPSSSYIISKSTFPNYFMRDKDHAFALYAQLDAHVFGTWFARELQIKRRFVGEEPLDEMTRLYNGVLQEVLPGYGIEVTIIPRKHNDYSVISASKVRELVRKDDWEQIRAYVPQTTYDYLKQHEEIITRIKQHGGKH